MASISMEKLSKSFGQNPALRDINLEIADGEFFVLLGPTGAGKTTTLRLVAGLEKPSAGIVRINGTDVADWGPAERDVALVLQQYSLYPRLTVRQNLSFPLQSPIRKTSPEEVERRVMHAAKTLKIEHLLERKTDKLSGGEMQRVSIGRAIVREPHVFLMDEPLSNLDAKLREAMRSELKDLQMRLGATFLFVTHDQVEAMTMGDRMCVLNHGRIEQVGTPAEVYNHPRNTFVASFVGSPAINLIEGRVDAGRAVVNPGSFELQLPGASAGGAVTFGIRPEDLHVSGDGAVEAVVHDVENFGLEKVVTLRVDDVLLRVTVPAGVGVAVEEKVKFGWDPRKVMMFDAKSGENLEQRAAAAA
jgi:multiple sugar transport system ATP-binding protein